MYSFAAPMACNSSDFICKKGVPECIPSLWVCDGELECEDGSDETEEACGET